MRTEDQSCRDDATTFTTCVARTRWPVSKQRPKTHLLPDTSLPPSLSLNPTWALTLWNTESGLCSRSPLLVTEISAAELLWTSSAMVLSCEGGRATQSLGYSFTTTLQASHTGTEQLGCHLVAGRSGLDWGDCMRLTSPVEAIKHRYQDTAEQNKREICIDLRAKLHISHHQS